MEGITAKIVELIDVCARVGGRTLLAGRLAIGAARREARSLRPVDGVPPVAESLLSPSAARSGRES